MEPHEDNPTTSSREGASQLNPSLRKFHEKNQKSIAAISEERTPLMREPVQIPFQNNPELLLHSIEILDTVKGEDLSESLRLIDPFEISCSSFESNPIDIENRPPIESSHPNEEWKKCRHQIQSILQSVVIQRFQSVKIKEIFKRNWKSLDIDEIQMKINDILSFSTFKYSLPQSTIDKLIKEEMNPCPFNSLCSLLYTYFVEPIEEQFKIHIYLPKESLENVLREQAQRTVAEISSQVEPSLSSNYQLQIKLKVSEFLQEYRTRNEAAEKSKVEATKLLLQAVIAGYEKEALSLLGDEYIDKEKLEKNMDSVFENFLQILLAGCAFGDLVKNQEMKDTFNNSVQRIREKLLLISEGNLENELMKYLKMAKESYSEVVGKNESKDCEHFDETHRRAMELIRKQFDSAVSNSDTKFPGHSVKQIESKLTEFFEESCLKFKLHFEQKRMEDEEFRKRQAVEFDVRKKETVEKDDHYSDQLKPTPKELPNSDVSVKPKNAYLRPISSTEYSREYQKEIEEMQKFEKEAEEDIIKTCVKHYEEKTLSLLGDWYFDEKKLNEIHDEILNKSLLILGKACSFQDEMKNRMIKGVLTEKIGPLHKNLVLRNENNRRELKKKLMGFLNVAMELYSDMMRKEEYQHFDGFMKAHGQVVKSSHNKFQTEILNSGNKYPPDMIKEVESKLVQYFEQARLTKLSYFEQVAAKEADERRQREAAEIEARKMEMEAQKKLEIEARKRRKMELRKEANLKTENFKETSKKGSTSSAILNQMKDSILSSIQLQAPQVASTSTSRSPNPRTAPIKIPPLQELPEIKVAIHLGLNRTKLGFTTPAGEFHMLFDLENILYFDERQMVSFKEGEADRKSLLNKFSFVGLLMKEKLDEIHQVKLSTGEFKSFRIEEILSFFLTQLKWKAELELKRKISECLIVVPQSLNLGQREAVSASVKLANFQRHSLINDTHAMALTYLFEDRKFVSKAKQLITVNLFEGFIDTTSFRLDNDLITHIGTSGECFIPEDNNFRLRNLVLDIYTLGFHRLFAGTPDEVQKKSKKIFSQQELVVNECEPTVTVISTPKELLCKLKLLQPNNVFSVDENYALMGATYLLRLAESNSNDRIYQIWRKTIKKSDFKAFRRNLAYGYPEKYNYKPSSNTVRGLNLSRREFNRIELNYFLHDKNVLHDAKLEVLKMLSNLEPLDGLGAYHWTGHNVKEFVNECSLHLQMGFEIPLADILEMSRQLNEIYELILSGTI